MDPFVFISHRSRKFDSNNAVCYLSPFLNIESFVRDSLSDDPFTMRTRDWEPHPDKSMPTGARPLSS